MNHDAAKASSHLALLRGINVGGKNILPMKALAQMFVESGCSDVRTYIQSGNVIFNAPPKLIAKLPAAVGKLILNQFGLRIPIILRSAAEVAETIRNNPYVGNVANQKTLHVMFLAHLPDPGSVANLDPARSPGDSLTVRARDIYMHLANGAGNTKLTNAYFDSKLTTTSTLRNWATVLKLAEWMGVGQS